MHKAKTKLSRQTRIETLISEALTPSYLVVDNESNRHQVPKDAETHYKVIAVSQKFNDLSRIARHRLINKLLCEEFNSGMHALSLHLYKPEEWAITDTITPKSPPCHKKT